MSRKECTSVLIESSAAMLEPSRSDPEKSFNAVAFECLAALCHQKLLYAPKTHEVGLIRFGTKSEVIREYSTVSVEFVQQLDAIKDEEKLKGVTKADPFGALQESLFQFKKSYKNKGPVHRVFLFTTLEGETSYDQTSTQALAEQLRDTDTRLNIILLVPELKDRKPSSNYLKNKGLLDVILNVSQSAIFDSTVAIELYRQLRTKTHYLVTKFRGFLEITPDLKIGVCSYTKSTQETLDSLKKFSKLVEKDDGRINTGIVKSSRSYYEHDDPTMKPIEQGYVQKAFLYGRQIVPIPNEIKDEMKVVDDKQLRLLCFSDQKDVPRHYLLNGVDIVIPLPDDKNILGFNSLVDGLLETEKVGIVRYTMRSNTAPKLAAIFPHKSKKGFRCLYLSQLPTAEDIRDYQFSKLKPANEEEKDLLDRLVEKMDLMHFNRIGDFGPGYEVLRPSETFNPVIQQIDRHLISRGVYGQNDLLQPSESMMEELTPETVTHKQVEEVAAQIRQLFGLEEHDIQRVTARARIFWQQLLRNQREEEQVRVSEVEQAQAQKMKLNPDKDDDYINDISMVHPVSDFNEMRKNKKHDLMDSAMVKMGAIIERLIQESIRGSYYEKALTCLIELRKGCIEEDEFAFFNDYLRRLRDRYRDGPHRHFWNLIVRKGITLISTSENRTSNVTDEESIEFLTSDEGVLCKKMDIEEGPNDDLGDIE
jgi:ATP-dependent DNA helicase 2 subunit 2